MPRDIPHKGKGLAQHKSFNVVKVIRFGRHENYKRLAVYTTVHTQLTTHGSGYSCTRAFLRGGPSSSSAKSDVRTSSEGPL